MCINILIWHFCKHFFIIIPKSQTLWMETALYKTGSLCFHLYVPKVRASLLELNMLLLCCPNDINGRIWSSVLMLGFHRSWRSYDLEILYDRGVVSSLILDGRFVLGCPWLSLTDRGQYQTLLIFSTASKIHLVGELILAGHPRSPYIWSFIACGDPRWPAVALYT